jgi:RNA polymerase sigma-70 factor (ECF subfamily)
METDEELVHKAQAGDAEAFGVLVERHQKPVIGFLMTMFHDLDLSEESAQQAFVKAFQALGTFEGRSDFSTWVSRIAVNAARSHLRWAKLRRWFPGRPDEDDDASWDEKLKGVVPKSDEMDLLEKKLALENAMTDLSAREREIAALRLEGYSLGEISGILEISEGTVKSTLFTATRKMRRRLP